MIAWLDEFRMYLTDQGRSRNTVEAYCRDVGLYASWFKAANVQEFEPGLLNAPDLREYRSHSLGGERVSAATWNRRRASLLVFTDWAQAHGWVAGDPMQGVGPMEAQALPPFWLPEDEFRKLRRQLEIEVNAARTEQQRSRAIRDRAMVALMVYAGLRSGEVAALEIGDITLAERSGEVRIRNGKGNKAGQVPLGREAREAVRAWLEVHPGGAELFAATQRQMERRVHALGARCGVDLWPHRLRHTFVRRLVFEKNQPLTTAQGLARHSRVTVTARYAQASRGDMSMAVEDL